MLETAFRLTLGAGVTNAIADTARLTLAGGGVAGMADSGFLQLNGGTETVASLMLGGILYTSGTFTSADFPEYLAGAGAVQVSAVPEPGSSWILTSVGLVTSALRWRRAGRARRA